MRYVLQEIPILHFHRDPSATSKGIARVEEEIKRYNSFAGLMAEIGKKDIQIGMPTPLSFVQNAAISISSETLMPDHLKSLFFYIPSHKKRFLSHQNWLAVVAGFKYRMKYIKEFM